MMEDDPDYGYYCETAEDNVTPVMTDVEKHNKKIYLLSHSIDA